jgi:hypothetical protein
MTCAMDQSGVIISGSALDIALAQDYHLLHGQNDSGGP